MDKKIIRDEVIEIIVKKFSIQKEKLEDYSSDCSLFDASIGMLPRDLLTLFFLLQNKYNITFEEADITEKRFDYLENIVDAIIQKAGQGLGQ